MKLDRVGFYWIEMVKMDFDRFYIDWLEVKSVELDCEELDRV